jgi:hypothetical protein
VCFPLDVPMVHSSALAITTDGECLTCGGFSAGETIRFRSLEFNANCFDGLSLSPNGATQAPLSKWFMTLPPTPLLEQPAKVC